MLAGTLADHGHEPAARPRRRRGQARGRRFPDDAEGVGQFVNGAKALVTPALVMTAAICPLAVIAGGLVVLFGGRRGHGHHRLGARACCCCWARSPESSSNAPMPRSCRLAPADPAHHGAHPNNPDRPGAGAVAERPALRRRVARAFMRRGTWVLAIAALIVAGGSRDAQAIPPIPNPLAPIGGALERGRGQRRRGGLRRDHRAPVRAGRALRQRRAARLAGRGARTSAAATSASCRPPSARWARRRSARSRRSRSPATGSPGWPAAAQPASRRSRGSRARSAPRCFSPLWPWLFDTGVALTNLFTRSLMGSG